MSDENESSKSGLEIPVLELPPTVEIPAAHLGGGMFSEDHLGIVSSKLMALDNFLKLLSREFKFQDFIREILLIVMKAVKSEAGSVFEMDHQNRTLFFRAAVGQSSDVVSKFVVPVGQGIVGFVAESRQPLVVNDLAQNQIHMKSITKAVGFEAKNLVAVPLIIRGQVYGVLELLNRVGDTSYTNADLELLNSLCESAARTIEIRMMLGWSTQAQQRKEAA